MLKAEPSVFKGKLFAIFLSFCYTESMTTKRLVRISYFTMLTIMGGLIRIPVPLTPIRFTLQVLFVAASGLVLGGRDGAFAQIAYAVLGLVGLPIFTSGGGIGYVFEPSFGYILGFPLQAFLTGFLVSRQKTLSTFKLFLCSFAGLLASYALGISYQILILTLVSHSTFAAAIATVPSVLLMLVKDIVLVYLLCLLYPKIMNLIGKANQKAKTKESVQPDSEREQPRSEGEDGEKIPEPSSPKNPVPEPVGMAKR